jgi:WG containing repeat
MNKQRTKIVPLKALFLLFVPLWLGSEARAEYLFAEIRSPYGYVDESGNFVIPPSYQNATAFSDGKAAVTTWAGMEKTESGEQKFEVNGGTGFIDRSGKLIIQPQFRPLCGPFHKDRAVAQKQTGEIVLIDSAGNVLSKLPGWGTFLDNDLIRFSKGMVLFGLADTSGRVIFEPKCAFISDFCYGYATAKVGGKYVPFRQDPESRARGVIADGIGHMEETKAELIDAAGKIIMAPQYEDLRTLSPSSVFYKSEGKWGVLALDGKVICPPKFDDVDLTAETAAFKHFGMKVWGYLPFPSEGKAIVKVGKHFGYVDSKGALIIDSKFVDAWPFSEGLAPVAIEGDALTPYEHYGYINAKGRMVIPPRFQFAKGFRSGLAVVAADGKFGVIKKDGKYLFDPIWDSISEFVDGLAVARKNDLWNILRQDGQRTTVENVQRMYPFSEGLAPAQSKEQTFYAVENGTNKVIERKPTKEDIEFMNSCSTFFRGFRITKGG